MNYLKHFLIGSSFFATLPFYIVVNNISTKKRNYSYFTYTMIAPLWLGLWSVLSIFIGKYLNLSTRKRLILMSFITYFLSIAIVTIFDSYNYSEDEWNRYYIRLFIQHFFMWNFTVYLLEKYI